MDDTNVIEQASPTSPQSKTRGHFVLKQDHATQARILATSHPNHEIFRPSDNLERHPTQEVLDLNCVEFIGNIHPRSWTQHLRKKTGAVDLPAIVVLAEICFWYSPTKTNGGTILKRKFAGDILQKSYDDLAEATGLTKRQVSDAVKRLEEFSLITRELRTVQWNGNILSNVLFIRIHPGAIRNITVEVEEQRRLPKRKAAQRSSVKTE